MGKPPLPADRPPKLPNTQKPTLSKFIILDNNRETIILRYMGELNTKISIKFKNLESVKNPHVCGILCKKQP